jgi:hypothetical protein
MANARKGTGLCACIFFFVPQKKDTAAIPFAKAEIKIKTDAAIEDFATI